MNIRVKFSSPYYGAVHVRDSRKSDCMKIGSGEEILHLNVNLFSKENEKDYCGVFISKNLEVSRCCFKCIHNYLVSGQVNVIDTQRKKLCMHYHDDQTFIS